MLEFTYDYIGEQWHAITLGKGFYEFKLYGAQGGGNYGGKGGFSYGIIKLRTKTTFYGFVGGQGSVKKGGYNGGGNGGSNKPLNSKDYGDGGGSTDIRYDLNDLDSRIIVAAGGGGTCGKDWTSGGAGGGITGEPSNNKGETVNIQGATQTTGNAKLYGQNAPDSSDGPAAREGNGGGGGGWYGGLTNSNSGDRSNSAGSGGSSYISGHPECVRNSKYFFTHANTIAGLKDGNGLIIINFLGNISNEIPRK